MATRMTGECHFGLHAHCQRHVRYGGAMGWVEWLPCECSCHSQKPTDIPDEVWANWAFADDDAEYDGRHGPWPEEE